ncbi:hypothetical protein KAJ87_03980 [Candidatus Pacearchaeota archaeon]|nr:hypothetical protein [Candidatus Pacearchaeota archaeon]
MREKVWGTVLGQLIKEHGLNLDLKKFNILNTDFTFQKNPEKLPNFVISKINEEMRRRLSKK